MKAQLHKRSLLYAYPSRAPDSAHAAETGDAGNQGSTSAVTRRGFIQSLAALASAAGLPACRRPEEPMVGYVKQPQDSLPGVPLHYATCLTRHDNAFGVIVECHEGHPTKVEGNPRHPESLGGTTAAMQACLYDLYDQDRSHGPRERGQSRTWAEASAMLLELGRRLATDEGASFAILYDAHRSPTLASALTRLKRHLPKLRMVRCDGSESNQPRLGAALAFGRPVETLVDWSRVRRALVVDGDPFTSEASPVRSARAWASSRSESVNNESGASPIRLYVMESRPSLTGCVADHRFALSSRAMLPLLAQLAVVLTKLLPPSAESELRKVLEQLGAPFAGASWAKRLEAMAKDLIAERGRSVVLVGDAQSPVLHALGHWINDQLANVGSTIRYQRPFDDAPAAPQALTELSSDILNRTVKTVLVLGGNPLFAAPSDSGIKTALASAELTIHCGTHYDESARGCHWHLNLAHELEAWGDAVARDGTVSIVQPMLQPLWDGKTGAEVVTLLTGSKEPSYALVQVEWKARWGAAKFEERWRRALLDGAFNQALEELTLPVNEAAIARAAVDALTPLDESLELVLVADPNLGDGRYANNGWLQELPHPITKTTWGNPAWISEALARQHGMRDGQVARITANGATLRVPVLIVPGQHERSIALALGGGHWNLGKVANGVGVNAHALRSTKEPWITRVERFEATDEHVNISRTQTQFDELGRGLTRVVSLGAASQPAPSKPPKPSAASARVNAWGMAIDLAKCTGCSACVVACESENNIPFVGSDGIRRGRAMQWLRVDRYFSGTRGDVRSSVQPMPCQQCENAPCETVCPVGATAHSTEGLNDMVYNRCVGSRYCANNCPFEVRRFNYFEYNAGLSDLEQLRMNPDVSVRSRGVMEKCTFCVQRIQRARIAVKLRQEAHIADGAVTTACEQACPTRAIVFGDLNVANSRVAALSHDDRAYRLLDDLNLEARVYYLADLHNPHPDLESS